MNDLCRLGPVALLLAWRPQPADFLIDVLPVGIPSNLGQTQ